MKRFNNGFSLVELMVAAAISSGVFLFSNQFFSNVKKDMDSTYDNLSATISNLLTEQVLRHDLTHSKPSLNTLKLEDDNKRIFFDFDINSTCSNNCSRSKKLTMAKAKGGSSDAFYMIIQNHRLANDILFNPADAYEDETLSFVSLNKDGFLIGRELTPWVKNGLVHLYSTYPVYPKGSEGVSIPRFIQFFGWVKSKSQKSKLRAERLGSEGNLVITQDPRSGSSITSEDEMLENIPYVEGLANYVYISSVKMIRYRIVTKGTGKKMVGQLFRGVKKIDGTWSERVINPDIEEITFTRENISSPSITVKI